MGEIAMAFETWAAFAAASIALPLIPGPAILLVAAFVGLALNATAYALLAGRLSGAVARPGMRRGFNRLGGAMLVGAGLATATLRRA
jgi:threonine/homoserine/homoserine lactone efflux protein